MTKTYRPGAVGALMDEYERAGADLTTVLESISDEEYERVRDTKTNDPNCVSIQTIMTHVIRAGYNYAAYMREAWGIQPVVRWDEKVSRADAIVQFRAMLAYMVETLRTKWDLTDEESNAMQMTVRWGPIFNFEQLFEHAIVHVLRHRRQIERFLGR